MGTEHGAVYSRLDVSAVNALNNYAFPGNVRELENILERALALSDGDAISADDLKLPSVLHENPTPSNEEKYGHVVKAQHKHDAHGNLEGYLESIEKEIISEALEASRWNKTAAAKLLGISFRSLRYKQKKLGLDR